MHIPQDILSKFIVRKDYLEWIKKETSIFVYLDLTNMSHWQDVVEIAMDMLDDSEKMTAVMLFSGDSDLTEPLERLKIKSKKVGVVGVRGRVSNELYGIKDKYIDFGKFYTGKRSYESENPAEAGPHN